MKKHAPLLLLAACAALCAGTFYFLLKARFDIGDVYPPSSSLRSDPLGSMILFESLQALPGVTVDRDHSAVNRLPNGAGTTYFHLAADSDDWSTMPAELYRTIDRFLLEGGRLVITMKPEFTEKKREEKEKPPKKEEIKDDDKKDTDAKKKKGDPEKYVYLKEKWGLEFSTERAGSKEHVVKNISSLPLPKDLKWHGDIILEKPDSSWTPLYKGGKGVVFAEKKRGSGSIVVATDSYFMSNEAMVRDRQPELLAWLVGANSHVVFDEAHFGIMETPGVAALARKYRLHGGAAALIVLAGLFIWKNSSSLAPHRAPAGHSDDIIPGRNAALGFVGLLKRNIPGDRLLFVCLEEWLKSFAQGSRFTSREKAAVEEIVHTEIARPARDQDPVAAYEKICATLHRGAAKPKA